jgi:hypothetical protein
LVLVDSEHFVDELESGHVWVTFTVHYQPVLAVRRGFVCHGLGKNLEKTFLFHDQELYLFLIAVSQLFRVLNVCICLMCTDLDFGAVGQFKNLPGLEQNVFLVNKGGLMFHSLLSWRLLILHIIFTLLND